MGNTSIQFDKETKLPKDQLVQLIQTIVNFVTTKISIEPKHINARVKEINKGQFISLSIFIPDNCKVNSINPELIKAITEQHAGINPEIEIIIK